MFRKLSALAMIAALGLAIPTPAEAQGQTRAQKAAAAKAKKAEAAREKAALKENLAKVKARQKIGKTALKRAMADMKVLARQELNARKRRLALKPAFESANLAFRANPTQANGVARENALQAYLPVRAVHEAALARLDKARSDVRRIRQFQKASLEQAGAAAAAARIRPVPRARPAVDPRFVVDLNPTDVSVATSGGGLLGGESAPRRTQAYGPAPQQGGEVANYGPASFVPQQPPTGAQLYTSAAQGQPFRVRQNIYEQPGDPLD